MFINVVLQSQQMRKKSKKERRGCITSMGIAKHDFLGRSLKRLKLILRLEHSTSKKRKSG